jgi:hypothetical protein
MSALGRGRAVRAVELVTLAVALLWLGAPSATARAAPPPPVRGLDACRAGPHCDYGAAYERFATWGNVAPQSLGDCTFAAAADWEQIVLGIHAHAAAIRSDFARAGGSERTGLTQTALWSYWQKDGIEGAYLAALHGYAAERTDVENAVRTFVALIVELNFTDDDQLAQYELLPLELHDVIVDGFTPTGPLVVTWGQTLQMTWAQWDREESGMWVIATRRSRGSVRLPAPPALTGHSRGLPPGSGLAAHVW